MPFLLAFWKPIACILAVLALVAFVGIEKHRYDERRRDEGRQEVQAKWDQAIAAQKQREAAAAKEADDFQRRADAKREADFNALLGRRTAERNAALAAANVASSVVDELRNAVRAANATGAGEPAKADTTITGTTGLALAQWFDQVASLYRACKERVDGWRAWDDARVQP